ncbi:hypothetical protein [Mycobacterium phage Maco6]|nr:hypothetical protein [Mycobacterium phage Maco7]UNY41896.1 hypothetical protein [Mycobacterium phage Maco6]WKV22142.1 dCMP deaminase [Mycobacteroides phage 8UZL]
MTERPTRHDMLLSMAFLVAQRATCTRLSVGAVASIDGRILSTGYNGAPIGMQHCTHPPGEPCTRSVHAEANAVAFAARHGVSLLNSDFYCTDSPCYTCACLLVNVGIKSLFFNREYRDPAGVRLLNDVGINVYRLHNDETPADNYWSALADENSGSYQVRSPRFFTGRNDPPREEPGLPG